jgi:soluble lytic murein transglycosylase
MQLIPETAHDLKVIDPFDVKENIRGGSQYLRMMLDQFSGDLDLALAAYNAGPTAVKEYGGIPPFKETIRYVEKVKTFLEQYRQKKERSI